MRQNEIDAMKADIPFYVQKVINIIISQMPAMPTIVNYTVSFDTRHGWYGNLTDTEGGMYFTYGDGYVSYREKGWNKDKLSAMAATMTDGANKLV